ncbi:Fusaric acid resistance protein-like-domain-containing protein [Tirmania nivea]|nr:Fusaric acid resistance protein-like-domain-containing protein [Tirmania nivea]
MASGEPETPPAQPGSSQPEGPRISIEPRRRFPKHVQLDLSSRPDRTWGSGSSSQLQLDQYDTYGVEEHRDGFFDASFFRPLQTAPNPNVTITPQSYNQRPYFSQVIHTLVSDFKDFLLTAFWTHQGVNVAKSLLAYLICYYLCLIPTVQKWLGNYSYFATISVLLNHSGRTFGAQLDGLVLCILGASVGMGWGCMALELSDRIGPFKDRREGLLEAILIIFAAVMALLRSTLVRLYQALMSAGLAVFFMCLVDSNQEHWDKKKVREFAVPFLVGQAVCLAVNVIVFPGAGGREVTVALHNALISALEGLRLPREPSPEMRRDLNMQLVNLSEAFRDMRMELTISKWVPFDIAQLRNILQAIIRDLMAIDPASTLFEVVSPLVPRSPSGSSRGDDSEHIAIDIDTPANERIDPLSEAQLSALELVKKTLGGPARKLIDAMSQSLAACDVELMGISGYRKLSTSSHITCNANIQAIYQRLNASMIAFDEADISLIDHPLLPHTYSKHPELVQIFLFVHPLRQAADSVQALVKKVIDMTSSPKATSVKIYLPSYPWRKSLHRTNPQVRHDRGGVTANYYYRSKGEIDRLLDSGTTQSPLASAMKTTGFSAIGLEHTTTRYRVWRVIHRLQGFEARFAIKLVTVTALLSLPVWLDGSQKWYNHNAGWWAVITAWFMMHPRVGGNAQDIIVRTVAATIGAAWGGLAYAVGHGNPYIMAAFATIYMFPAVYRFTTSSHPRSGLMACLSFSVVSLATYNRHGFPSAVQIAWTRGLAIVIGICAAVVVNWCIWPFVARHELRKAISAMMLNLAIIYSGIVARYIYHEEGMNPTEEDVEKSAMLDAKIREMFLRIRELFEMTTHEIRLRGPFNPTLYGALIDCLERFFEHLVQVRQSSLYFQPYNMVGPEEQNRSLLSFRRDAVASILMSLYVMAGALRIKKPIPRYLPSAAVARKHLLDQMEEAELETEEEGNRQILWQTREKQRRWADVYQFAYSSALTDIVGQLEELETLTKGICGEMALDIADL